MEFYGNRLLFFSVYCVVMYRDPLPLAGGQSVNGMVAFYGVCGPEVRHVDVADGHWVRCGIR